MTQFAQAVEQIKAAGFRVHDGVFSYRRDADAAAATLRERGLRVSVQPRRAMGGIGYVVRCEVEGRWQDVL